MFGFAVQAPQFMSLCPLKLVEQYFPAVQAAGPWHLEWLQWHPFVFELDYMCNVSSSVLHDVAIENVSVLTDVRRCGRICECDTDRMSLSAFLIGLPFQRRLPEESAASQAGSRKKTAREKAREFSWADRHRVKGKRKLTAVDDEAPLRNESSEDELGIDAVDENGESVEEELEEIRRRW